ncbi:MAG: cytochrome B6, partial [Symploca sp. SIO2E6]|nr:cytochrome B6 [Symploca sp. SIO2E6]
VGGLLEGPATEDLSTYEVKEEDDLVLVKLS